MSILTMTRTLTLTRTLSLTLTLTFILDISGTRLDGFQEGWG